MKMTVPVLNSGVNDHIIKHLIIDSSKNWKRTHQASLISNYSNSPYFDFYFPYLEEFLGKSWHKLMNLNLESSKLVLRLLRQKKEFEFHSETPTKGTKEERIIQLLEQYNCQTYVIESDHKNYFDDEKLLEKKFLIEEIQSSDRMYEQQFGNFISGMSILDSLFNEGPNSVQLLHGKKIR